MVLYLIDYENVKNAGLTGIDRLSEDDKAVIFYSPNADTISFEVHHALMRSKCRIDFYKIRRGGKNFLDFQLSTYLGYMMKGENFDQAVIISKDQGFDSLIDFWESGFVEVPTKLYRFMAIGAFLNYISGKGKLSAQAVQAGEVPAIEPVDAIPPYVEYDPDGEEIPDPIEREEQTAFELEISEVKEAAGRLAVTQPPEAVAASAEAGEADGVSGAHSSESQAGKQRQSRRRGRRSRQQKEQEAKPVQAEAPAEEEVTAEDVLGKYPFDRRQQLVNCIKTCKKKQDLYITLIKAFGKKKGCEYYHDLKGHFDLLMQS